VFLVVADLCSPSYLPGEEVTLQTVLAKILPVRRRGGRVNRPIVSHVMFFKVKYAAAQVFSRLIVLPENGFCRGGFGC